MLTQEQYMADLKVAEKMIDTIIEPTLDDLEKKVEHELEENPFGFSCEMQVTQVFKGLSHNAYVSISEYVKSVYYIWFTHSYPWITKQGLVDVDLVQCGQQYYIRIGYTKNVGR